MTATARDDATTIPSLVRSGAARFGERTLMVTPDDELTYAEAERRSRRLAGRLLRAGVGKGTPVGMWYPQGPDFVVALFAITRIGAIAVPLSTFLQPPELRTAIRHADLHTLLAPGDLLGRPTASFVEDACPGLASATGPTLALPDAPYLRQVWLTGGDAPWATGLPALSEPVPDGEDDDGLVAAVEAEVRPSDAMVMVFTSGATAEPKAVVHTHGAQLRHSMALARLYGFDGDVRTFTTMPLFWVGGLTVSLLTHLHVGATVITVERLEPLEIVDLLERARPTRVVGWTLWERLEGAPELAGRDLGWLFALQQPSARLPRERHNSLGMTETSGPHTGAPAASRDEVLPPEHQGSFGPPVPGAEHRIVDPETGAPVEDGVEGEICVRGVGLMDRIHKRERRDTFDADGWYHTGDRGSFRDGLLFFTGRATGMIKTAGANVAPGEVEAALVSLPGVQAAFVAGVPDADRGEVVAALVCPEPGHELDPAALVGQLRSMLSSYKVPRRFVVAPYEDAPWLPSGKVSRPRLVERLTAEGVDPRA